jgi:hypothetical protein
VDGGPKILDRQERRQIPAMGCEVPVVATECCSNTSEGAFPRTRFGNTLVMKFTKDLCNIYGALKRVREHDT